MTASKKIIAVFDFDGTITKSDSMIALIRYAFGAKRLNKWLVLNSPRLILTKLGFVSSAGAKERLLTYFLKGMAYADFQKICEDFFRISGHGMLRKDAVECIDRHKTNGDFIIIVSASADAWIKPFAQYLGIDKIISSQLEVAPDGKLTGKLIGKNCKGREKVSRLQEICPDRTNYIIKAYGDSSGDKELLQFADISHYKAFNN